MLLGKEGAGTATGTAWVARAKRRVESVRCLSEYMVNWIFCQVRADEISRCLLIEALSWLPALFYVEKKSFVHDGCLVVFISEWIYQHQHAVSDKVLLMNIFQ